MEFQRPEILFSINVQSKSKKDIEIWFAAIERSELLIFRIRSYNCKKMTNMPVGHKRISITYFEAYS